jgi:hypothetical protein
MGSARPNDRSFGDPHCPGPADREQPPIASLCAEHDAHDRSAPQAAVQASIASELGWYLGQLLAAQHDTVGIKGRFAGLAFGQLGDRAVALHLRSHGKQHIVCGV